MVGITLRLSKRIGVDGRSQIIVKLALGPNTKPCFKSGIYIKPSWLKSTTTGKGNRYYVAPPTNAKNDVDVYDAIDAKNRLDTYCNMLLRICQITNEHDKDKLTRDWVDTAYRAVVKNGIAARDINYNMLEQFYVEKVRNQILPKSTSYNGNFFKLIMAFQHNRPRGTVATKMIQLGRIIYRYERYICLTDAKRHNFHVEVDYFDQFTIIDFQDYMLNEEKLLVESGKLVEILKPCPDLPPHRHYDLAHVGLKRGQNTVSGYMITFKAFYNWLQEMDITKQTPFKGYVSTSTKYGIPFYLTIEERNKVADYDLNSELALCVVRDIFIFQCHVGCRYGDLCRLTPFNINGDMLVYYPHKTKDAKRSTIVKVPLSEKAKELIRKYAGMDPKGRLFPVPETRTYNGNIKKVIETCGIVRNVPVRNSITGQEEMKPIYEVSSSHMARRTFIGAAYKMVKDPNLIGKMSGHSEGSKAFTRYRAIDEEDLRDVINQIQ